MNRYEREKPNTGGARAAVNGYWNRKSEEERRRYLHAMWQNHTWYEVWRALFHNVHTRGQTFSWAESHERLRRYVQALKDRH